MVSTLSVGSYSSKTIRDAIVSVLKAQWRAAHAIDTHSTQAMYRVILPQSVFVSISSLANSFISFTKDTLLVAAIIRTGNISGCAAALCR
ncbi:ABC transporter permease subunit [Sodalis sp.]|uniref:ABC transporter permease subunit n=1 Tax=Sodalis sp. (in: enterobacteria) TaxID=1898979 RepID=UPI00387382C4